MPDQGERSDLGDDAEVTRGKDRDSNDSPTRPDVYKRRPDSFPPSDHPQPVPAVAVGRVVHYWTEERGQLTENAALVTRVVSDGRRVELNVFWNTGHGDARVWATWSTEPKGNHWTWPARV